MVAALLVLAQNQAITIENIEAGALVRHPLVLLRGQVPEVAIRVSREGVPQVRFPSYEGRYVAFAELLPGTNFVILEAGRSRVRMRIDYRPASTFHAVRPVWVRAKGEPAYATPPGFPSRADLLAKLDLTMKLAQAVVADAMSRKGYGPQTFSLAFDRTGRCVVQEVILAEPWNGLRANPANEFDAAVRRALVQVGVSGAADSIVPWLSPAGHDPWAKAFLVDSSVAVPTWSLAHAPASLAELPRVLANRTPIDPNVTPNDTSGRSTAWAAFATLLGRVLNVALRTSNHLGIDTGPCLSMDQAPRVNRVLMAYEPPAKDAESGMAISAALLPVLSLNTATRLRYMPWMRPDLNQNLTTGTPTLNRQNSTWVAESPAGIRLLSATRAGHTVWRLDFPVDSPRRFLLANEELSKVEADTIHLVDDNGRIVSSHVPSGG